METQNVSIEIAREKGFLSNISLSFPIWISTNLDKSIDIEMPFLGLSTSSQDEDEIDLAIEEAIKAFCIICDKYGQGLEKELEFLGWESSQNRDNVIENLQILTPKENNIKRNVYHGIKLADDITLTCPICKIEFSRSSRNTKHKLKSGKIICCSRKCGGINSHITKNLK